MMTALDLLPPYTMLICHIEQVRARAIHIIYVLAWLRDHRHKARHATEHAAARMTEHCICFERDENCLLFSPVVFRYAHTYMRHAAYYFCLRALRVRTVNEKEHFTVTLFLFSPHAVELLLVVTICCSMPYALLAHPIERHVVVNSCCCTVSRGEHR